MKNVHVPQEIISGLFTNCHDCRGMPIVECQHISSNTYWEFGIMGSLDEAFSSQLKCHFYIDLIDASAS